MDTANFIRSEIISKDGLRYDLQLKGSGKTIFSRQGDGRSPLGPVIREYIISEAMHYLGIPTTRSLSIIGTGEFVEREKIEPEEAPSSPPTKKPGVKRPAKGMTGFAKKSLPFKKLPKFKKP